MGRNGIKSGGDKERHRNMDSRDHQAFSFTRSAAGQGRRLETDLIEARVRLPLGGNEHPFGRVESIAHEALGLAADSPFLVVERARLFNGRPAAFHRAYLDPSRFPGFPGRHDLTKESLLDIYEQYGFKPVSRDTVLRARGANVYEINLMKQRYHSDPYGRNILEAEQKLYAKDAKGGEPFVLEVLSAAYLDDWEYEIKNRPA